MENKKKTDQGDQEKKKFLTALEALGLRKDVLCYFFRKFINLKGKKFINDQIIASIDGGVKDILDFDGKAEKTVQALIRQRLKLQTDCMYMYFMSYDISSLLTEGDLALSINYEIKKDAKKEEKLYQALFDMKAAGKEGYTYKTYDYFGQLINHWRGIIEIKRYEAYLKGKATDSPAFRETDLFIKVLERMHIVMGKRKRKLIKKNKLDIIDPNAPTFIRG